MFASLSIIDKIMLMRVQQCVRFARYARSLLIILASVLAEMWNQSYCSTLYWLRVRLSFSLLRSAIQCIRGARSSKDHAEKSPPPIDLISSEAWLQ